jgi:hypothetical protein
MGVGKKRENTIASYGDNFNETLKIIKRELKMKPSLQRLCIAVNGRNIPLTDFPEQIITNTIVGMLGSLKNIQKIKEFSIQWK